MHNVEACAIHMINLTFYPQNIIRECKSGLAFSSCLPAGLEEVLLLDMLVKAFICRPHPLLTHILLIAVFFLLFCGEILSCCIALDAPEGWGRLLLFSCSACSVICEGENLGRSDDDDDDDKACNGR